MPLALIVPLFFTVVLSAWANGYRKRRDDDDWPSGAASA